MLNRALHQYFGVLARHAWTSSTFFFFVSMSSGFSIWYLCWLTRWLASRHFFRQQNACLCALFGAGVNQRWQWRHLRGWIRFGRFAADIGSLLPAGRKPMSVVRFWEGGIRGGVLATLEGLSFHQAMQIVAARTCPAPASGSGKHRGELQILLSWYDPVGVRRPYRASVRAEGSTHAGQWYPSVRSPNQYT